MQSQAAATRLRAPQVLLLASLTFGLFFGAGNLIFPVSLGLQAGTATPWAAAGFLITAVGLPILGVIALAYSGADSLLELAGRVSRRFAIVFTGALYLTIGPFFAIPRTATVSYEMAFGSTLTGSAHRWALLAFSAAFFVLVLAASLRPGKLMDYVGKYLTPVFLVLLAVLLIAALADGGSAPLEPTEVYATNSAVQGALDGYNTMDALASLAFAIVLIDSTRRLGITSHRSIAAELTRAGIIAAIAMGALYAALTVVGSGAGSLADQADNGAVILAAVSHHHFGETGRILAAAIMFAACIKTAIGLATACVEMFATMIPRVSARAWAFVFTGVSFALANVGLDTIIQAAVPVLSLLYPLAITLIALGLLTPVIAGRAWAHRLPIIAAAVVSLLALLTSLPILLPAVESEMLDSVASAAAAVGGIFPGFDLGMGWILPTAIGLAIGMLIKPHSTNTR